MSDSKQTTAQDIEDFYNKLNKQLEEHHNFPEDYTFKFIMENNQEKLTEIFKVFDQTKNTVSARESSNGKYTSITITAFVLDANQVIALYKEVGKIEGIIML